MARVTVGYRCGLLTVTEVLGRRGHDRWVVAQCDCGSPSRQYRASTLRPTADGKPRRGRAMSCGCLRAASNTARLRTHGRSRRDSTYKSWCGVIERTTNPGNRAYPNYGGRGIDIDPRWQSFETFLADMGERPPGATSIERKDNDRGYWPDNCVWLPRRLQPQNRRSVVWIEYEGQKLCMAEACRRVGIPTYMVKNRRRSMTAQAAFDLVRGAA